jgi:cyclopropane fatty-acyl-phospholipid synthase-like methyltransferase
MAQLADLDVAKCTGCGHQFSINLRDSKEYSRDYFENEHANWFLHPDVALFGRIRDLILTYAPHGRRARIIDVGCGPGAFLEYLHRDGFADLHGLDLYAADTGHFRRIVGEFESTQLHETFDVIVSMMNIEHVPDPHRYVAAMHNILGPGGVVLINTIDSRALIYSLARLLYSVGIAFPAQRLYEKHHLNHFTGPSLDTLMNEHGFACRAAFAKNYPMDAIDWPKGSAAGAIRMAVGTINAVSDCIGGQISQTKAYLRRNDA